MALTWEEVCEKLEAGDPNFCDAEDLALATALGIKELVGQDEPDPAILECLEKIKAINEAISETITAESDQQEAIQEAMLKCLEDLKKLTESEGDETQAGLESVEKCLEDLKAIAKQIINAITIEGDETQEELKTLCKKIESLIEITGAQGDDNLAALNNILEAIEAQEDLDDTDDDLRPVSPKSYQWTDGDEIKYFVGYAKTTENGDFDSWVVLSGDAPASGAAVKCETQKAIECRESQEWTYGVDNTGTRFNDTASYVIELSNGTTLEWDQTPTTGWSQQLTQWAAAIQAAADSAGVGWFAEPRAVNNPIPTDISGNYGNTPTGLPGAPSIPVALAMIDGGMVARYVNIQICPGQPTPVAAYRKDSAIYTNNPYNLTTAGPVLGPLKKFSVCISCGEPEKWYLEDGVTEAQPGEIPKCWEPCGTLTLTDPPPENNCSFEITVACDNNNQASTVNFKNTITRRAQVCNGEQIRVDFFEQDPSDPTALVPYTMVGDFVDCATGEPIPLPDVPCSDFALTDLYRLNGMTGQLRNREWHDTETATNVNISNTALGRGFRDRHDFTLTPDTDTLVSNLRLNDTNNAPSLLDVQVIEGAIKADKLTLARYAGSSEGYWAVELGKCGGPLEDLAENGGFFPTRAMEFEIPKGVHKIRIWNIDSAGSNSSANLEISTDGGITWTQDNAPEGIQISQVMPSEDCLTVKVCKDSGLMFDLLTGEQLDPTTLTTCPCMCEPCCTSPQTLTVE